MSDNTAGERWSNAWLSAIIICLSLIIAIPAYCFGFVFECAARGFKVGRSDVGKSETFVRTWYVNTSPSVKEESKEASDDGR